MPESPRQFVLLRHERSNGVHWDLMLDTGEALATWQIHDDPADWAPVAQPPSLELTRLPDHRRDYLDYEGPVSGGRGHVSRTDAGRYVLLERRDDCWRVQLAGSLLAGSCELVARPQRGADAWELRYLRS
jgi:hypothetical protein